MGKGALRFGIFWLLGGFVLCVINCVTVVLYFVSTDMEELHSIKQGLDERIIVMSTKLVRQLKQRNRLRDKNKRYCDTITAVLQAVSKKRS